MVAETFRKGGIENQVMKPTSIKDSVDQVSPAPLAQAAEERTGSFWERLRTRLKYPGASSRPISSEWADAVALNQREFQVLSAAALLGGEGDTVRITHVVEYWSGRFMIARVHTALWWLQRRGLIRSSRPSLGEDGRRHSRFMVTEEGDRALYRAEAEGMPLTNC
jgi:hypothetical protein